MFLVAESTQIVMDDERGMPQTYVTDDPLPLAADDPRVPIWLAADMIVEVDQ